MEDILYTVPEVAKLLKTSQGLVYRLIKAKKLSALKLGALKVRRSTILKFLEDYEGYDISDPNNITELDGASIDGLVEDIEWLL